MRLAVSALEPQVEKEQTRMTGPISREVREIIAGELDMPVAKLSDSASFREDLGAGFPDDHRIE